MLGEAPEGASTKHDRRIGEWCCSDATVADDRDMPTVTTNVSEAGVDMMVRRYLPLVCCMSKRPLWS
jgi:hypothetical protein